eukprot:NODE_3519_length_917_cov_621.017281_g2926_i0.p1 GENE.NODE_3519_length_917_cov_621.017281_g2926_i0~~NODE_3519_length_917_cov_621.017281_g2926_i0.p1  ORF type:complete len:164 (+),score=61.79 NODE_3519_length_917_cov_621.017281_g2926_i0:113-604(+)
MSDKRQKSGMPPVGVKDIESDAFVQAFADHLKRQGKIEVPDWAELVKTSRAKEMAPIDKDWFYTRCASIARRLYLRPGVGVNGFRKAYSQSNYHSGVCPSHHTLAAGGNIRQALRALEQLGMVEAATNGDGSAATGRQISSKGQRELDRIAQTVYNQQKIQNQ